MCRPEQVPAVFSRQFLRSLVNTSASDAAMLHSAAKRCTDRLTAYVERSPDAQLQIAVAVALQRYGGLGFDRLSKTKTTAKLLQVPSWQPAATPCTSLNLTERTVRRERGNRTVKCNSIRVAPETGRILRKVREA